MSPKDWTDYIPLVNTVVLFIAIPIISKIWQIRREDLHNIDRRLDRLEERVDRILFRLKIVDRKADDEE